MNDNDLTIIELTEENIESMIYEIRGQRVMLDFDLARIYGYSTRDFNNQIKHNIERFDEDFRFQLTKDEVEGLTKWKKSTAQIWTIGNKGGRTTLPYVFTEQGIYMLMTVLRGELAIKQSKALIRLFKQMKDFITSNNNLDNYNEIIKLTKKVDKHDRDIRKVNKQLQVVMDNFIDPSTYKQFLILNGEKIEAKVAYQSIYSLAKYSIIVVDDYVNIETLAILKICSENIKIILFSDNKTINGLTKSEIEDFRKETNIDLKVVKSNGRFHDRYIVIDYKTNLEIIFHCGASSKDAGNKVTTIMSIEKKELYHHLLDEMLALI